MNKVILMGRLTKDPDFHDGQNAYARYTLAVDRMKKDEADFISCVAFGKAAEFANGYLNKGTKILVTGRIQTGKYEGKNGTVYTTDVVIENQEFCESKSKQEETRPETPDFIPEEIDQDLPFR